MTKQYITDTLYELYCMAFDEFGSEHEITLFLERFYLHWLRNEDCY